MGKIDKELKMSFADDRHRFITNVIFTANWFQNKFSNHLKPYGLSIEQFNVLRILRGAKDWKSMNDIKDLMVNKTPNTTRLSDKLLDKKLIERRRSETDRRVVFLHISEKGLGLLKEIDADEAFTTMDYMQKVSKEEAIRFSDVLDKLRD